MYNHNNSILWHIAHTSLIENLRHKAPQVLGTKQMELYHKYFPIASTKWAVRRLLFTLVAIMHFGLLYETILKISSSICSKKPSQRPKGLYIGVSCGTISYIGTVIT